MLALKIDMSDFIDQSALSEGEIDGFKSLLLDRIANTFEHNWKDIINENLHSTRAEYIKGMYVDRPDDDTVIMGVIARQSKLAVDLELGKDAFDEKQGFANSPKRTMKKDGVGWYITIPFRHAVPTALGESPVFADVMPVSVYQLARNQKKALKFNQLPEGEQRLGIRPGFNSGGKSFPAYKHKTAKYEGLVRIVDTQENRGGYFTFRRVSDLSDVNSWIHPGFLPRNLLGKALAKTKGEIPLIISTAKVDFFGNTD
jgi:hypothetical protein